VGGLGVLALAAYVVHARRTAFPLLDLKLLRFKTFRASVVEGSLFRDRDRIDSLFAAADVASGFGMSAFNPARHFHCLVGAMA